MNESILTFRCYRKKYNFRKLKKYIIIMIIFISIIIPTKVFADTENEIMNIFHYLAKKENKCIIIVTHSKNVASKVDEVFELKK